MDKEKIIQAGKIASQVKKWIKPLIKKGVALLEIAEKIESKIVELGGKPAFPTNLSIDNIAAHYTPSYDDKTLAHGLLKVDFGIHVDGRISDTAFSVDLENSEENKKLIEASEMALKNAIELIKSCSQKSRSQVRNIDDSETAFGQVSSSKKSVKETKNLNNKSFIGQSKDLEITTSQIGKTIQETIESFGFSPVINLSGHEMKQYDLHAGLTIPNIDNKKIEKLKEGLYAIEPFATNGSGKVHDGKDSGIYILIDSKNVRSFIAREILKFIEEEYKTLPFCSRWLVKKFGTKALFGLKQLEENGNLHQFAQLVELAGSKVSQAEDTILVEEDGVINTTAG